MLDDLTGRLLLLVLLLTAASALWLARRRSDGAFVAVAAGPTSAARIAAAELGAELGARATFVQFSAPTCATCPQVSRVLSTEAARVAGVRHVEVPAHERLDLVRRHGVLRTPTVLLLGPDGTVASRTAGPLDAGQARAALVAAGVVPSA